MAELLLELFSEEIPARMQARAAEELEQRVLVKLKETGLGFTGTPMKSQFCYTPRRLMLAVDGLSLVQPDVTEEKRGPRVGAPDQAIQGFLKSAGLSNLDQCEKRDTDKGNFWFAVIQKRGRQAAEILPEIVYGSIWNFPWPKSMRWADEKYRWIRPLHSILAVFDGQPLDLEHHREGIDYLLLPNTAKVGNSTYGHRFLDPREFKVSNFVEYKLKLREAYVVIDPTERQRAIWKQAEECAASEALTVEFDEELGKEVTGLVEWPVVLMGRIDERFMDLPHEVLRTSMRVNQKYISLRDNDDRLAPRFLVISNMETVDKGKVIVAGNERVLRARLADAKFFWDQDRRVKLETRVLTLKDVIFHTKLGTMAEKVERLKVLSAELATRIGADVAQVRRAALLAKGDLTSRMVGEFPELQGIMGSYYAVNDEEEPAVVLAIAEHYAPLKRNDRCPTAPTSLAVALADKIDTLVGFFTIDERPTGSKDPFALRRAALGVVRLVTENELRLPLKAIFERSWSSYGKDDWIQGAADFSEAGPEIVGGTLVHIHGRETSLTVKKPVGDVSSELLEFIIDRLKVALREKGVRHDLIASVFALGGEDDLVRLLARVEALGRFLESEDGANLLTAWKRAGNIVRIEEKKDSTTYGGPLQRALLRQPEEVALAVALDAARERMHGAIEAEDFAGAMAALARLRPAVDAFFDKVTVNIGEPELRINRLRLLAQIRAALGGVADFSRIEG